MRSCGNCGRDVPEDTRFCPSCGASLVEAVSDSRFRGREPSPAASPVPGASREEPKSAEGFGYTTPEELADYVRPVRSRLLHLHRDQPTVVYVIGMGDYAVGAALPQISCEAVGGRAEDALDVAYAYSLGLIAGRIYDDMMDRTIERRGKRTVWREFGDPVAIPIGLQLVSEMFEALSVSAPALGRIASESVAATFRRALVESARSEEQEKLSRRSDASLTFEHRLKLAEGKRGMLIAAGTTAGAIVGRGSDEEVEMLRNYGLFTGTANQLFDDSSDPDYPRSYRERALSESRDLTAKAIKCTDRLRPTEAQRKLRDICKFSEVPLL